MFELLTLQDFTHPAIWISLLTLTFLEVVLGIDNIIFISIVASKLPPDQQPKARNIGLLLAMVLRILLLLGITWIISLTQPLFTLPDWDLDNERIAISIKDLILIAGGAFLIAKSTTEIHHKLEGVGQKAIKTGVAKAAMSSVLIQILLVDMVFSFDSILTAIGLVKEVGIMIIAIVISMVIMMIYAGPVSRFINRHPTLQMLALSFLILIGVMLVVEGFHTHFNKGYIYFAIAFSLVVELLNMRLRRRQEPVQLHDSSDVTT
ncbi:MAG: TerC family protein [Saprospiraceae bacterium]|nr:TerC family protein [Saprospiraceae bacterium]